MSGITVDGSRIRVYTAAEATIVMKTSRDHIDGACSTGALVAVDEHPESSRRAWRILEADLIDWHRRGRPRIPEEWVADRPRKRGDGERLRGRRF